MAKPGLITLVIVTTAVRAFAADSDAPAPAPNAAVEVPAVFGSPAELEARFSALRALRTSADDAKIDRAFAELMQAKFAANWPNLEPFSYVLMRDADDALKAGNRPRQRKLLHFARDLSPSLLEPRLRVVGAGIAGDPADLGGHVRELLAAARVLFSDFHALTRFVANASTLAVLVVLLGCLIVLVVLFGKQWRYVAHDLTLLMPKGASPLFAYGLFVLLIALPLGLRFGIIGVGFVLLLLPFIHMDRGERIAASIAFLLLSATPLALPFVAGAWVRTEGRARDLYALTRTMRADEAKQRLERAAGTADAIDAQLALGLYAKRRAELDVAKKHFERVVALDQKRADAWVNLGAVRFLTNKTADAEAAFDKALELDPRSIPALFNSSRMYYKAGEAERGTKALGNAQQLDPERTGALVTISRMIGARFMVEETLRAEHLWQAAPYPHESLLAASATDALSRWLVGSIATELFALIAAGWLVLLWAVALAMRNVQTALPCPRCGRAICLRTDKDLPDRSLCGQCYHAFVRADVETAMRIAKEVECRRHERRRMQLVALVSILFSGAGHLLRGRVAIGAALCVLAAIAWIVGLSGGDVVPFPVRFGVTQVKIPMLATAGLLWIVSSTVALITVPKKD
ncbi:MAG: tetratricopeptide repeat protein [Deltaproteobacteria bacterium]|nr:tetratricopeptide repeat protein [Deltaproteobacteria bacterium]